MFVNAKQLFSKLVIMRYLCLIIMCHIFHVLPCSNRNQATAEVLRTADDAFRLIDRARRQCLSIKKVDGTCC